MTFTSQAETSKQQIYILVAANVAELMQWVAYFLYIKQHAGKNIDLLVV